MDKSSVMVSALLNKCPGPDFFVIGLVLGLAPDTVTFLPAPMSMVPDAVHALNSMKTSGNCPAVLVRQRRDNPYSLSKVTDLMAPVISELERMCEAPALLFLADDNRWWMADNPDVTGAVKELPDLSEDDEGTGANDDSHLV